MALVPNLVSLLGGEAAQLRNVANTVDHMAWLRARSATPGDRLRSLMDPLRIGLAGHSAGGAVAFEASWQQERSSGILASGLVLLDAVTFPADDVRLVATTHCDPENPSDFLCSLACGAATTRGRDLYQELLFLFLREALGAPALGTGGS